MKKTITLIFSFLVFSILLSYSLVYWRWAILWGISSPDIISKNIFINSPKLNYTVVSYDTSEDLSDFKLQSNCKINSKYLWVKENRNYFKIVFLDNKCKYQNIYLQKWEETFFDTKFNLKLFTEGEIFWIFSDLNSSTLYTLVNNLKKDIKKYSNYKNNLNTDTSIFESLKNERLYKELVYKKQILDRVINSRKHKYISPISWLNISTKKSKLPNAWRPYRSKYTDWIHHWWDVDASNLSDIKTIDEWVIIRIVKDFSYSDLSKIKYGNNLTYEDKLINLDILRWNQVWLKTAKGDIVFYSHLTKVYSNIKEGDLLPINSSIWITWITWVPDKNYSDYHLHFSVQKNPYNIAKAGKYSIMDYMKWDWYFRWENKEYILKHQWDIFEISKDLNNEEKKSK